MKKICLVCFFIALTVFILLFAHQKSFRLDIVIDSGDLIIIDSNIIKYKKALAYDTPLDIQIVEYDCFKLENNILLCVLLDCYEIEGGLSYNSLLVFLYDNLQFVKLMDGLSDDLLRSENYIINHVGYEQINISFKESRFFDVTLKNISPFTHLKKDLNDRMIYQSSIGHPDFSNGLQNIKYNNQYNNIFISFSKFIYGFYKEDIVGEIHYICTYSKGKMNFDEIKLIPYEDYGIVSRLLSSGENPRKISFS